MRSISVREMRAALPRIEQPLAEAGEVLITRNGKPVARVLRTVPREGISVEGGTTPAHAPRRDRQ
jgi:antitoxin (DNA-binding transcriptional repressor) of toxin-antitoxin stability system